MVNRKPLVLVDGLLRSVPDGDSLSFSSISSPVNYSDGYFEFRADNENPTSNSDLFKLYSDGYLNFNISKLDQNSTLRYWIDGEVYFVGGEGGYWVDTGYDGYIYSTGYISLSTINGYGLRFQSDDGSFNFSDGTSNYFEIEKVSTSVNFNVATGLDFNIIADAAIILESTGFPIADIIFRPSNYNGDGYISGDVKVQFRDDQSGMSSGGLAFEKYQTAGHGQVSHGVIYGRKALFKPFDDNFRIETSSAINLNVYSSSNATASFGTDLGTKIETDATYLTFKKYRAGWEALGYVKSDVSGQFLFVKDPAGMTSDAAFGWTEIGGVTINADVGISLNAYGGNIVFGGTSIITYLSGGEKTESIVSSAYDISFNVPVKIAPIVSTGIGHSTTISGGPGAAGFVGGETIIGADNGGTPGTDLAGKVIINQGTRIGGITTARTEFHDENGVFLSIGGADFVNYSMFTHHKINSGMRFTAVETGGLISFAANSFVQFWAQASTGYFDVLASHYLWRDQAGTQWGTTRGIVSGTTINTATTTSIGSGVVVASGIDLIEAKIGWWNSTSSTGGYRIIRQAFQNVGGTVTAIGSIVEQDAGSYVPAGEASVTCAFLISGTSVIPRITTPDTDNRRPFVKIDIVQRASF